MKNTSKICALLLIIFFTIILTFGCNSESAELKGGLSISIDNSLDRAIGPNIPLDVSYYMINGTGPNNNNFSLRLDYNSPSSTQSDLECGEWNLTANAYNADDRIIGNGTAQANVLPNTTTPVSIEVAEISGTGTINLEISGFCDESITYTAHIFKNNNGSLEEVTSSDFVLDEDSLKVSLTLDAGFYYVQISASNDFVQLPDPEAFRIVKGDNISASYEVFYPNGIVSVSLKNSIPKNPSINISISSEQVVAGNKIRATASCSDINASSYSWFLKGTQLESTANSVELTFETDGDYVLTCLVADVSSAVWSEKKTITVVPVSEGMMTVTFYNGDQLLETRTVTPNIDQSFPAQLEQNGDLVFGGWALTETRDKFKPSAVFSLPYAEAGYRFDAIWEDINEYLTVNEEGVLTRIGDGLKDTYVETLTIPNTMNGNIITSIGEGAFYECANIIKITLPDSTSCIGYNAFVDCSSLTSINIPDSVTSIENRAFRGCSSLSSITIPNGVTSIKDHTFMSCSGLNSVVIPDSVVSIGYSAFELCSNLSEITLPDSVLSIGEHAFQNCTNLTSINIPNSVTSIGGCAFEWCENIKKITIGSGITTIGSNAFSTHFSNLTEVCIDKIKNSIDGSPWGAPESAIIKWKGEF